MADDDAPLPRLVERSGPNAGREHLLVLGTHVMGRERSSGVPLDGPDVSRRHATIEVDQAEVRIADLESKNGVLVDGREVPEGPGISVGHGARIELGGVELELLHPAGQLDRALRDAGEVTMTRRRPAAAPEPAARGLLVPLVSALLFALAAAVLWWFA